MKEPIFKRKKSLLELEKDVIQLKDRELKVRKVKIKLFFKPIIVSKDDMDRFEKQEMKKVRPIKNTWYDWLINYISESIRNSVSGFKDEI